MLRRSLLALIAALALPTSAHADPVIDERFDGGALPAGWTPVEGTWNVADGRLVGRSTSAGQLSRLTFGPHLDNYRFEVTLRFESVVDGARWTALALDMPAGGGVPWWQAALRSNTTAPNGLEFAQRTAENAWNVPATAAAPSAAGVGRDVRVRIDVQGAKARYFFDGTLAMERRVLTRSSAGGLGLLVNGSVVSFDNVRVTELEPEPLLRDVPAVIAHRGYSSITPENTLAAMAAGARAGADWVEIDVATSADGVPYVIHDNTVDRTTDGTGALPSLASSVLDGLDAGSWFSPAFTGQPLPRFSAALDEFERGSADLLLEIKGPETRAEMERIIGMIRERGLLGRVLLQSFDEQVLRDAFALEPSLRLGLLRGAVDADPVAVARSLHAVTYNPSWGELSGRREVIKDLHRAGIAVMPYTVDDPAVWAQMRAAGVDGIITNRAGSLVGWNSAVPAPKILAPADGSKLTRGDVVTLAVEGLGAATLDGRALAEGDAIRADDLALGRHVVELGGVRATFTVEPTARGVAHLIAVARGVPDRLRPRLLELALDRSWSRLLREAREHHLDERLIGDVKALR